MFIVRGEAEGSNASWGLHTMATVTSQRAIFFPIARYLVQYSLYYMANPTRGLFVGITSSWRPEQKYVEIQKKIENGLKHARITIALCHGVVNKSVLPLRRK